LRLLFDANLSPKLVDRLSDLFQDSTHVFNTNLARFIPDEIIWEYAPASEYAIVTADSDFCELAKKRGAPPKSSGLKTATTRPLSLKISFATTPFASRNSSAPSEQS
jgi:predicted nuclease of predicted toxin-antitoxin system